MVFFPISRPFRARTRLATQHLTTQKPQGDINNKIGFTDGIMGSTGLDKLKEQNTGGNNPGVEGALDVDPDVIGATSAF